MGEKRYYSVEEANAAVPRLAEIFGRVMQIRAQLKTIYRRLDEAGFAPTEEDFPIQTPGAGPDIVRDRANFKSLVEMLEEEVEQVHALGCQIKDLETGLVDWFALAAAGGHEMEILLCWRYGEAAVGFWHDLESGFAGRRPVSELEPPRPTPGPRTLH